MAFSGTNTYILFVELIWVILTQDSFSQLDSVYDLNWVYTEYKLTVYWIVSVHFYL